MSAITEKIVNLKSGAMKFGTENTRGLLDRLGSPDDGLKIIHIAGTNGKGSVAEYMTQILIADGKKVGAFTSPQVVDFSDQIKINGEPLPPAKLDGYLEKAFAAAGDCTSFEIITAAALYAFFKEGCEYAVTECGLGGLYDATNAVRKKELALISSIGLEHTAVLGNSIRDICVHKAGIIKNCPAIVNALQPDEAREYFKSIGCIFADKPLETVEKNLSFRRFTYGGEEYVLHMAGSAQAYDAAVAVEAAKFLNLSRNAIHTGISRARLKGRLQFFDLNGRKVIVDGCHNPSGFLPLKEVLEDGFGKVTLIFGCLADKDIDGMLGALKGLVRRVITVVPDSARAMDPRKISDCCKKYFGAAESAESVSEALEKSEGATVVCGSFTLVKEALNWIEKRL